MNCVRQVGVKQTNKTEEKLIKKHNMNILNKHYEL